MKLIYSEDRITTQLQTNIREVLEPIAANPISQGHLISSVKLLVGINTVPTGLNRPLVGWIITRLRAASSIYDLQDTNTSPSQNLLLVASMPVTIDIYVF